MTDDAETVSDVLEDHARAQGGCPLLAYHQGLRDAASLTYEDWTHPMKASGGRIAIREDGPYPGGNTPIYYHIENGDDLVARIGSKVATRQETAIQWLKLADPNSLEPVLASETPSGGPNG